MKAMSKELYQELWLYIDRMGKRAESEQKNQAENMAKWAHSPTDIAFTSAVKQYKRAKEEGELLGYLINELEKLEEKDETHQP